MNERPKIKLELTIIDKLFEIIGWNALLAIWVLTIMNYSKLPDIIPVHFNFHGQADSFDSKGHILILPIVATVIFVGLTILNKFPHIFNYPIKITEENALKQYLNATRMIRYLKFMIVIIFGLIELQTIRYVKGYIDGLGIWFFLFILGLVFIPLIYFIIKSFKMTK